MCGASHLAHISGAPAEGYPGPWLVAVTASRVRAIRIGYKMSDTDAPWPETFDEG
jgi:hypothetical protein